MANPRQIRPIHCLLVDGHDVGVTDVDLGDLTVLSVSPTATFATRRCVSASPTATSATRGCAFAVRRRRPSRRKDTRRCRRRRPSRREGARPCRRRRAPARREGACPLSPTSTFAEREGRASPVADASTSATRRRASLSPTSTFATRRRASPVADGEPPRPRGCASATRRLGSLGIPHLGPAGGACAACVERPRLQRGWPGAQRRGERRAAGLAPMRGAHSSGDLHKAARVRRSSARSWSRSSHPLPTHRRIAGSLRLAGAPDEASPRPPRRRAARGCVPVRSPCPARCRAGPLPRLPCLPGTMPRRELHLPDGPSRVAEEQRAAASGPPW